MSHCSAVAFLVGLQLLAEAIRSAAASRSAAWSFLTPGLEDGVFLFVFLGELGGGGQLGLGVVVALEPVQIIGQLEPVDRNCRPRA